MGTRPIMNNPNWVKYDHSPAANWNRGFQLANLPVQMLHSFTLDSHRQPNGMNFDQDIWLFESVNAVTNAANNAANNVEIHQMFNPNWYFPETVIFSGVQTEIFVTRRKFQPNQDGPLDRKNKEKKTSEVPRQSVGDIVLHVPYMRVVSLAPK